ncbi:MAG: MerR family DNA-binding transcriptional regulator [Parcubacteria group bacterium]|nr:MerR family DNA-binding transcriptional regulator [Parcubacteria group bacterium]
MPKQFLTVKQVSKILGVTSLTVRNWDKRGKLQAYRNPINNYRVYKIEEVEKLLGDIDQSKDPEGIASRSYGASRKEIQPKVKKLIVEEL